MVNKKVVQYVPKELPNLTPQEVKERINAWRLQCDAWGWLTVGNTPEKLKQKKPWTELGKPGIQKSPAERLVDKLLPSHPKQKGNK